MPAVSARVGLVVLLAALAAEDVGAQAMLRFPGDRPGRAASTSTVVQALPTTFAWYGDSITAGACNSTPPPQKLMQLLPGYYGVNRGVSGENMAQIAARYFSGMATDCLEEQCGTYVVAGGTNNCGTGTCDTDEVLATHLSVVDDCLAKGRYCVSLNIPPFRCAAGIPSCVGGTYAGTLKSLEYRTKWQAACVSPARPNRAHLTCVDVYTPLEEPWEDEAEQGYLLDAYACSSTDRVHTSQAGADKIAELVRAAFP